VNGAGRLPSLKVFQFSSLFWGDRTTLQSKKYFRQTLWQLQQALHAWSADGQVELHADGDSLRLNTNPNSSVDTAAFEEAFHAAVAQNMEFTPL
jgi:DNA-binding SARP family transcriptional activator